MEGFPDEASPDPELGREDPGPSGEAPSTRTKAGRWERALFAGLVVAVGVVGYAFVPVGSGAYAGLGAEAMPRAVSVLLIVSGIVLAIQETRGWMWGRPSAAEASDRGWSQGDAGDAGPVRKAIAFLVVATVYVYALPVVGYLIASVVAFGVVSVLVSGWHPVRVASESVGTASLMYLAFLALGVQLPRGVLPWW